MFVHLGGEVEVRFCDIVAVFDIESSTMTDVTRNFLKICEKNSIVTNISADLPKSFIITTERSGERLYISNVAAGTIHRRIEAAGDKNKGPEVT